MVRLLGSLLIFLWLGIGAAKAAYSTLLFPLVALTVSTFFEGYVWTLNAVFGILLILLGNYLMFSKLEIGKKLFNSQKLRSRHKSLLFISNNSSLAARFKHQLKIF